MSEPSPLPALLDGSPAFAEPLHVGRPNVGDRARLQRRIDTILDNRWFSNHGPMVQEFERRLAEYLGVPHVVCLANATLGLELVARALGLSGEVIVPAYTFVATAHALEWQRIRPVFADLDPATHNVDPASVEARITPRTTGILATHVWGQPCPVGQLEEIASRRGLALVFDAAHALACTHGGRPVGGFGRAEVFSFHATKFVNAFEGGAVATRDATLAERVRRMSNFGFAGYDRVVVEGTNAKMSEVSAAMGITSLEEADRLIAVNMRNHAAYADALRDLPGVRLLAYDRGERHNHQYVVAEVDPGQSPLDRDHLVAALQAEGVLARKYFWPGVHRFEPYRSREPDAPARLPQTERLAPRVLVLPTGTSVDPDRIARIGERWRAALEHADAIRRWMATTEGGGP